MGDHRIIGKSLIIGSSVTYAEPIIGELVITKSLDCSMEILLYLAIQKSETGKKMAQIYVII